MKHPVTMPALSDTMNNGRLVKWLKQPGQSVRRGETIAEVETDKAIMEVEAFHDGYLAGPLSPVDSEFPVGQTIGYIADEAAEAASPAQPAPAPAAAKTGVASAAPAPARGPSPQPAPAMPAAPAPSGVRASPYARRLARELGVDLKASGAAPIDAAVVLSAAQKGPGPNLEAGPPYRIERNPSVREAVARNMMASAATPSFHVTAQLLLAPLQSLAKEKQVSLVLLLARASALTIKAHPLFNAVYTSDGLARRERVDVGIAVNTPDGLFTPVLRDMAGRPMSELSNDWRGLREKVTTRRLAASDYQGATFYLSDLGVFPGVYAFDSLIPAGASAILSVAAARDGTAMFTLTSDHRVIFGADAAAFLQTLGDRLSTPAALIG